MPNIAYTHCQTGHGDPEGPLLRRAVPTPAHRSSGRTRAPARAPSGLRARDLRPAEGFAALREGYVLRTDELDIGEALRGLVLPEVDEVDRPRGQAAVGPVRHLA